MGSSQVALVVKNPPAKAGDVRNKGSVPGSGRSPGVGHGNPPQYSGLENLMGRGAWQFTVHGRKESDTTERPNMHTASSEPGFSKDTLNHSRRGAQEA